MLRFRLLPSFSLADAGVQANHGMKSILFYRCEKQPVSKAVLHAFSASAISIEFDLTCSFAHLPVCPNALVMTLISCMQQHYVTFLACSVLTPAPSRSLALSSPLPLGPLTCRLQFDLSASSSSEYVTSLATHKRLYLASYLACSLSSFHPASHLHLPFFTITPASAPSDIQLQQRLFQLRR